jgi:hypothetical protein
MRNQLTTYQNAGDTANFNSLVPQFNSLVNQYNTRAAESKKVYAEIQEFYQYFKPDYQPPPEEKITISLLFQILFQISAAFYFDFV